MELLRRGQVASVIMLCFLQLQVESTDSAKDSVSADSTKSPLSYFAGGESKQTDHIASSFQSSQREHVSKGGFFKASTMTLQSTNRPAVNPRSRDTKTSAITSVADSSERSGTRPVIEPRAHNTSFPKINPVDDSSQQRRSDTKEPATTSWRIVGKLALFVAIILTVGLLHSNVCQLVRQLCKKRGRDEGWQRVRSRCIKGHEKLKLVLRTLFVKRKVKTGAGSSHNPLLATVDIQAIGPDSAALIKSQETDV